jgi:hypothetical protein
VFFPILAGRNIHVVAEDTPEVVRIRETALFGDLLNRQIVVQ